MIELRAECPEKSWQNAGVDCRHRGVIDEGKDSGFRVLAGSGMSQGAISWGRHPFPLGAVDMNSI